MIFFYIKLVVFFKKLESKSSYPIVCNDPTNTILISQVTLYWHFREKGNVNSEEILSWKIHANHTYKEYLYLH